MTVSLQDAIVGFTTTIVVRSLLFFDLLIAVSQHLDGHEVEIKRTRITQPGQVLRIKGEGMPQHNFPSDTGDLYVTVQVVIPVGLTAEQRGALAKILPDEL